VSDTWATSSSKVCCITKWTVWQHTYYKHSVWHQTSTIPLHSRPHCINLSCHRQTEHVLSACSRTQHNRTARIAYHTHLHVSVAEWLARLTMVWEDAGSHWGWLCLLQQLLQYADLGTGCGPLLQSIQPSTLHGKAKRVSAYGLSNNDNVDGGRGR